jgi:DNA repair protein RecN (Recombination protein N)
MLEELSVSNLGLIENLNVSFGEGFNVITGETGVGKSMLLGALSLLLGARANSDMIRHGETQAMVTGVFRLKEALFAQLKKDFSEFIIEDTVYLRRVITKEGRSKSYIGDAPVTLNALKEFSSRLVEVHGQHEHQALMQKSVQIQLLDRFGKSDELRKDYQANLKVAREKKRILDNFGFHEKKRRDECEYIEYQLEEFNEINPQKGELTKLEKEIKLSANYQKISMLMQKMDSVLTGQEGGILDSLRSLHKTLSQLEALDSSFGEWSKFLGASTENLEELSSLIASKNNAESYSAKDIDKMISRAEKLKKLYQKHGLTCGEEAAYFQQLKDKLVELKKEIEAPEKLAQEIADSGKRIYALGENLFKLRQKASKELEKSIEKELKDLGMPDAKIKVVVEKKINTPEEIFTDNAGYGIDDVEFMFLPNPGEPYRPLREIASGGELARTMLSVAKVLSDVDDTDLIVFDEIDANIGGRLGTEVGSKISLLSHRHQIVCVTHLPQIASFADRQYKISKVVLKGVTKTSLAELTGAKRLQELAEMIQGKDFTDITLKQAEDLLNKGQEQRKKLANA